MDVTYTARAGGLRVSGHSAGNNYTVSADVQAFFPQEKQVGKFAQALDGTSHGTLDRTETHWKIKTADLDASDWDNWQEFVASATPADSVTVYPGANLPGSLPSSTITGLVARNSARLTPRGVNGLFTASFTLIEVH